MSLWFILFFMDEGVIAVRPAALGEAVTHLPWLTPAAASLVALARPAVDAGWRTVRTDPAAVLLVVRQTAPLLSVPSLPYFPALLREASVVEGALLVVRAEGEPGPAFVDWSRPAVAPIYWSALHFAHLSALLAERTRACDAESAWVAGLLAPLGWLAVAAVDPERAARCLADPELRRFPEAVERRHWGHDAAGLARRLARRWRLPPWLAAVCGHLALPAEVAESLGADVPLFRVVQLAVGLAREEDDVALRSQPGATPGRLLQTTFALPAADLEAVRREAAARARAQADAKEWAPPASVPLLRDLLELAAENRRARAASAWDKLEREADALHLALETQIGGEADRLLEQKMAALAEFAAGAGHEINNPLAVISGQAQYLLRKAQTAGADAGDVVPSLQTIIASAQRVHHLLRELMQFARPPRPHKQPFDVSGLACEVVTSLREFAERRQVELTAAVSELPSSVFVFADPSQVRTALTCLVRNAVEAAPAGGWAAVRLVTPGPGRADVVVEDSGPGPGPREQEHLFDPFYSGRLAGRGRGLGLPTAWRLAREQDGDVTFAARDGQPTRFVLSLPLVSPRLDERAA